MKRHDYLIVIGLFFFSIQPISMYGHNVKRNIDRKYDVICEGNGVEGTYLVKVGGYANIFNLKPETLRKYAVHGIIFKGPTGSTECRGRKPFAKNLSVKEENKEYFDEFLELKRYTRIEVTFIFT